MEEKPKKRKLIDRILAPTPAEDKVKGKLSTVVGTACGIVLTMGLVSNPVGIAVLTLGATIFGVKSIWHAQKVDDKNPE